VERVISGEGEAAGDGWKCTNVRDFCYSKLVKNRVLQMAQLFPNLAEIYLPHWRDIDNPWMVGSATLVDSRSRYILEALRQMKSLTRLEWPQCGPLNDTHLLALADLPQLHCLKINHGLGKGDSVGVSMARQVDVLSTLTNLHTLHLQTTDAGSSTMGFIQANQLAALSVLTKLTSLSCTCWEVTDEDVARLATMTQLRELDMFTMAGQEVEFEFAMDHSVTDTGLIVLTQLRRLEKLQLPPSSHWTREGQAALLSKMPTLTTYNAWYEGGVDSDFHGSDVSDEEDDSEDDDSELDDDNDDSLEGDSSSDGEEW
jgi:hypothetical protein